jgi:hypothetical protein
MERFCRPPFYPPTLLVVYKGMGTIVFVAWTFVGFCFCGDDFFSEGVVWVIPLIRPAVPR